jgi:hypothetical protein
MRTLALSLRAAALFAAAFGLSMGVLAIAYPDVRTLFGIVSLDSHTVNSIELSAPLRALSALPTALAFAYSMAQLAGLLGLAARGEVFSAPAANYLRRAGLWLLITTLAGKVMPFLATLLQLWLSRPAHGEITLGASSNDVWNIFLSALFMLVARVLADAYRIAEENRQII